MAMPAPPRRLTYAEYAALPDDGKRYQLIDGELFMTPSPGTWHQKIAARISWAIETWLSNNPIGDVFNPPLDVVLAPDQVVQPDVIYVASEHRNIIKKANIQGAPDLVVEVLSPGTEKLDMTRKRLLYAEHGVKEYWVVAQEVERVEVFRLGEGGKYGKPIPFEGGETLTTPLLPDFSLQVSDLYRDLPEA